jgi:phasin
LICVKAATSVAASVDAALATKRTQPVEPVDRQGQLQNLEKLSTGRGIMAEEAREPFEMPKDMRSMAEASVEQARKTFERFLEGAETAAGTLEERGATVRAGAKDIGAKAIAYAEKNVQASLDYAQSLLHAKDLAEVMRLHSDFVQSQMRNLAEQANEMGQIVSRAAMDAAKPKN